MKAPRLGGPYWGALWITGSVGAISVLHYVTSYHSVLLHEIFKRLYYVPVVVASVNYGLKGGLATSAFSSALYIPHIAMNWHAWPVMEFDQYGETLLFNVVALVTGSLADRLRRERNRYRQAAVELESACRQVQAGYEERQRLDRLVTIGRVASGVAHEVRNPLASVLGCLEILESDLGGRTEKCEFLTIAKRELRRLDAVAGEFLEFAHPPLPSRRPLDLGQVVGGAVRLAKPDLLSRGLTVELDVPQAAILVDADTEQVRRALLNILLDRFAEPEAGRIRLTVTRDQRTGCVAIDMPAARAGPQLIQEIFEPFPAIGNGHGLSLAIARRLIENQGGTAQATMEGGAVHYRIELPLCPKAGECRAPAGEIRGTSTTTAQRTEGTLRPGGRLSL